MNEKIIEIGHKNLNLKIAANFRENGEESILFLHGLGCSRDCFKDVWNFPEFKKFSILAFDLVGFGESSKPKEFSYTMEEQAEVCKLVIDKLNLDKVHLTPIFVSLLYSKMNPPYFHKIISYDNVFQ